MSAHDGETVAVTHAPTGTNARTFGPPDPRYAERGGTRTLVALLQQTLMVMHGKPDH